MSYNLYQAGGPLLANSPSYITRQADEKAAIHLRRMDYISLIEPREQGKTSLINHLNGQFSSDRYTFAFRDMMAVQSGVTISEWYTSLGRWLLRQLKFIPSDQRPALPTNSNSWEDFLAEIAERAEITGQKVVIVLDEIGAIPRDWANDFFSVIRSVYTSRQSLSFWQYITFIIAGAFNPKELIQDTNISNFNVDMRVPLDDFTLPQLMRLVSYLGLSKKLTKAITDRVHYWTDGQPYLSQQLCTYLANQKELITISNLDSLVADAVRHFFNDDTHHLERIKKLSAEPGLLEYTRRITSEPRGRFNAGVNDKHFRLAHIIGVIKASPDGWCQIRNRIYEEALAEIDVPLGPKSTAASQPQDVFRYDAFISYNHEDSDWVYDKLLPYLEHAGLRICLDYHDFEIGKPRLINIENAVDKSRKTLLILTPNWITNEWNTFESLLLQTKDPLNLGQRILPLLVQPCTLPNRLQIYTYLDLTKQAEFDFQMQRLVASIHSAAQSGKSIEPTSQEKVAQPGSTTFQNIAYELGLTKLGKSLIQSDIETRLSFAMLELRLLTNVQDEQRYGPSEAIWSERERIVEGLNRLAITHLDCSFNDLCKV